MTNNQPCLQNTTKGRDINRITESSLVNVKGQNTDKNVRKYIKKAPSERIDVKV